MENVIASLLILIISWAIAHLVKNRILLLKEHLSEEKHGVISLLASSSYIAILSIGLITALARLGVNITALVAGLGLTGFALGFAMKDIISNLLAGVLLILMSPFRVGDTIKVGSHTGRVIEINLRYTIIEGEKERILIPNSTMFTNIISVKKE